MLDLIRPLLFCLVLATATLTGLGCALAKPVEPRQISTGVFITSISDLEPADGSFRMTGYIWFIDPQAQFDPLKEVRVLARDLSVTSVETIMLPDGASYSTAYFDAVIDTQFDVAKYPFDGQVLQLVITARTDVTQLVLAADNESSGIADVLEVPGWVVGDLQLSTSYKTYSSGFGYQVGHPAFSRLTVTIDTERKRSPLMFEKFTGFLVALIITALAFVVPPAELGTRLGMLTSAIFAAVFNLNRLEDAIGFDASFGLVDQVSIISFSAILSSLAFSIYVHRLSETNSAAATRLNRRSFLGFVLLFSGLLCTAFGRGLS